MTVRTTGAIETEIAGEIVVLTSDLLSMID